MTYNEIEERFQDEMSIETLIMDYEDKFNLVEEDGHTLTNGEGNIEEILKRETGIYMLLNIVVQIADTRKKKEEGRLNYEKIKVLVDKKQKVVQSSIDREVSCDVQYLRRVRNLFTAYRNSADKCILACQSILKKPQRNINTEE